MTTTPHSLRTSTRIAAAIGAGAVGLLLLTGCGDGAEQTPVQPAADPAPISAPVLIGVPNVVGMTDTQARDTLRAAGFTNVVLGPSTGSVPGVAAGTVTNQLPGASALASAGDPITLGEASEPPAPVVVPQSAPVADPEPTAQAAPPVVANPDADRPHYVSAPDPVVVAPDPAPSGGGSAYYKNCAAARAAGAAPLHVGDPGYRAGLDRDGDGIACE